MDERVTCRDCGMQTWTSESRPDRCQRCHHLHYCREYSKRRYRERVKTDPEMQERHRQQSREGRRRYWEKNKDRLNAKRRKGSGK